MDFKFFHLKVVIGINKHSFTKLGINSFFDCRKFNPKLLFFNSLSEKFITTVDILQEIIFQE